MMWRDIHSALSIERMIPKRLGVGGSAEEEIGAAPVIFFCGAGGWNWPKPIPTSAEWVRLRAARVAACSHL
jgi:hypothetical protein